MDSRERVIAALNFEEPDVVPVQDSPWPETVDRWKREGFPAEGVEVSDYFGFDIYYLTFDLSPRYETFVYEETDRWRISTDGWGSMNKRWKGRSGTPHFLVPAVRNLEEFKERIEPFLDVNDPTRLISPRYPFRGDLEKGIRNLQKRYFVAAAMGEPFEIVRALIGTYSLCANFIRNPCFLAYMFDKLAEFMAECSKSLVDAGIDGVRPAGDLAYRNGPFFSPAHYRKLLAPAHEKMFQPLRKRGIAVILHTDGDVRPMIPDLIEAGVTAIHPLEAKAGMDVRELKRQYGDKLAFHGNIDVRALSGSIEDVKEEVSSKVPIACEGGGYILGSDHSVPPSVSLQNYECMIKLARKYSRRSK